MTTDSNHRDPFPWMRKLLIPMLAGAMIGGISSSTLLWFLDSDMVGGLATSATIAALVGLIYIVIAMSVLVGAIHPAFGARFLNVEDADELREQKQGMACSGAAMVSLGVGLLALALAAPDGPLPNLIALILGAGGLIVGTTLSLLVYRVCDELMLAVSLEAGAITYGLIVVVLGGWAMLAHVGYAVGPRPLDLLTSFYVLVLIATFIAAGRRGMLKLR